MSKVSILIKNALRYYDNNTIKYKDILKDAEYLEIIIESSDIKKGKIIFYDKNKHQILEYNHEILGVYASKYNIWTWAWALPNLTKTTTYISRKILDYGFNLNPEKNKYLRSELTTSRYRITSPIQTQTHVAIASYLAHNPLIFEFISVEVYGKLRKIYKTPPKGKNYKIWYFFLFKDNN